jgi:hypothetical protein
MTMRLVQPSCLKVSSVRFCGESDRPSGNCHKVLVFHGLRRAARAAFFRRMARATVFRGGQASLSQNLMNEAENRYS